MREMCSYPRNASFHFLSCLLQVTGRTTGPTLALDGSFDAYFAGEAPFGNGENQKEILGIRFLTKNVENITAA
jgi:hypothetical protein